jgi:hypothetical protein
MQDFPVGSAKPLKKMPLAELIRSATGHDRNHAAVAFSVSVLIKQKQMLSR